MGHKYLTTVLFLVAALAFFPEQRWLKWISIVAVLPAILVLGYEALCSLKDKILLLKDTRAWDHANTAQKYQVLKHRISRSAGYLSDRTTSKWLTSLQENDPDEFRIQELSQEIIPGKNIPWDDDEIRTTYQLTKKSSEESFEYFTIHGWGGDPSRIIESTD